MIALAEQPVDLTLRGANLLTNSRMASLKSCPKKHWFSYELALRPDRVGEPLRMGSAFHLGLEVIGKGGTLGEAVEAVRLNYSDVPEWAMQQPDGLTDWMTECEKVTRLVCGHAWRWGTDPMEVVQTEQVFDLPLRNPETGATTPVFRLAGKLDKIVRLADGRLAVQEYKTCSEDLSQDGDYWRHLRIDQQISLYMLAARELGFDVQTVIFDVSRKPSISPKKLSQQDTTSFLSSKTYFGEEFDLRMDGEVYTVNGQQVEIDASGKKPVIRETPAMYGARLNADIAERPTWYFARREIPRLEMDLEEFAGEVWHYQKLLREMQLNHRWPRNSQACFNPYRCPWFDLCGSGWKDDGRVPSGFRRAANLHEELE